MSKPLKRFTSALRVGITGLKPGVNETHTLEARRLPPQLVNPTGLWRSGEVQLLERLACGLSVLSTAFQQILWKLI
jgi:hypothetical protein